MRIKNVTRCIAKEADLDITGATLLTKEEAKELPKKLLSHDTWWWTRSPSRYSDGAISVSSYGYVNNNGTGILSTGKVRPVLTISNLESSGLKIGDEFEFGGQKFEIISNDKAFCLNDIGECAFRQELRINVYEMSNIKKYVDEWFERSKKESTSEDKEKEIDKENEIKEIKEKLDKLSKELEETRQTISPRKNHDDNKSYSYPTTIRNPITNSRYYKPTTNTYDKTTFHKFEKSIEESNKKPDLDISGATLLTTEEVEKLPERLREYNNSKLWWVLQPRDYGDADYVASVYSNGIVSRTGDQRFYFRVRPALIISNFKSSGLRIGDTFKFGDKDFEIISNDRAFCLGDIGYSLFREDCRASDVDDYEKSDIKNIIDDWFKKSMKENNDES